MRPVSQRPQVRRGVAPGASRAAGPCLRALLQVGTTHIVGLQLSERAKMAGRTIWPRWLADQRPAACGAAGLLQRACSLAC